MKNREEPKNREPGSLVLKLMAYRLFVLLLIIKDNDLSRVVISCLTRGGDVYETLSRAARRG
jgi:hypothetical protein